MYHFLKKARDMWVMGVDPTFRDAANRFASGPPQHGIGPAAQTDGTRRSPKPKPIHSQRNPKPLAEPSRLCCDRTTEASMKRRASTALPIAMLVIAAVIVAAIGFGCTSERQSNLDCSPGAIKTDLQYTQCNLMRHAEAGVLPRHLSADEAKQLVEQFQRVAALGKAAQRGEATGAQVATELQKLDAMSRTLTGLPFDQVFRLPDPSSSQ